MKNDVVRWSSTAAATTKRTIATKKHNKHHNHQQQQQHQQLQQHYNKLSSNILINSLCSSQHHPQHVAETSTTAPATNTSQQHDTDFLPTLAFNESKNLSSSSSSSATASLAAAAAATSVKCDTNVYDLYLVQNIVNSRKRFNLINNTSNNNKHEQQHLNCLYQQQLQLTDQSWRRSSSSTNSSGSSSHGNNNYGHSRTPLMFLLQLSALVLICSLNIGFVASANIDEDKNSLNAYTFIPPYELDYEESGNDIGGHYTHTWAVHIPNGDDEGRAQTVANDHGFVNLGKVCR